MVYYEMHRQLLKKRKKKKERKETFVHPRKTFFSNILAILLLADFYLMQDLKGALDSQPQVIKFTSCLPMVGGSLRVLRLLPPLKLVAMI
jgi:hypothetical protein